MPSPVAEQPGVLARDPFRYSDSVLIIPPPLLGVVDLFDGVHSELDAKAELNRITGSLDTSQILEGLWNSLSDAGFLLDDNFEQLRERRHREFQQLDVRQAEHAGSAYPEEVDELKQTMREYVDGSRLQHSGLVGIAAPHVSPFGGWQSYRAAYQAITPDLKDRTFVILGTSHYGQPERFGLTRKDFVTPLGRARTDAKLAGELLARAASSAVKEDYCHAVEHSIEFQVLFLQWMLGPDINILPVLCGPFLRSVYIGGRPEETEEVRQLLDVLGDIGAREGNRLLWVLGIDMAHMGRRYGDSIAARSEEGPMVEVRERDMARIAQVNLGDADGFWSLVQEKRDDLK